MFQILKNLMLGGVVISIFRFAKKYDGYHLDSHDRIFKKN